MLWELADISQPLYTSISSFFFFFVVKESSVYCRAPSKQSRHRLPDGFQGKVFKDRMRQGEGGVHDQLVEFFGLVGGEVIRGQHYQSSDSNQSGVCMLVGSIQLTSPTWWGFQYLQNSSQDISKNTIYSP